VEELMAISTALAKRGCCFEEANGETLNDVDTIGEEDAIWSRAHKGASVLGARGLGRDRLAGLEGKAIFREEYRAVVQKLLPGPRVVHDVQHATSRGDAGSLHGGNERGDVPAGAGA
jgi:hypothetical protein